MEMETKKEGHNIRYIHIDTETEYYDPDGYDRWGYDKDGYNKEGIDKNRLKKLEEYYDNVINENNEKIKKLKTTI